MVDNRFDAAFEDFTLVRGLYCEVNASVLAACGTPKLHDMEGGIFGVLSVFCGELSSLIGLAGTECTCTHGHDMRIT